MKELIVRAAPTPRPAPRRVILKVSDALLRELGSVARCAYRLQRRYGLPVPPAPLMPSLPPLKREEDGNEIDAAGPDLADRDRRAKIERVEVEEEPSSETSFHAWFAVSAVDAARAEALVAKMRRDVDLDHVYVERRWCAPPLMTITAGTVALNSAQTFKKGHPKGIGVQGTWRLPGADGSGQRLLTVDQGWWEHPGLALDRWPSREVPGRKNLESANPHGTAVLGVILATPTQITPTVTSSAVGIAPNLADLRLVSEWMPGGGKRPPQWRLQDAVAVACARAKPGDIVLLECQGLNRVDQLVPVECEIAIHRVIKAAVKRGVIVIEAAGNGGIDIDDLPVLPDEAHPTNDPSGAFLVGGKGSDGHVHPGSNRGTVILSHADGHSVLTTTRDIVAAAGSFEEPVYVEMDGTSASAAIIAGVCLSVQGMAQAMHGRRLTVSEMRKALTGVMPDGTHAKSTVALSSVVGLALDENGRPTPDLIGVMPNLDWIATKFLPAL